MPCVIIVCLVAAKPFVGNTIGQHEPSLADQPVKLPSSKSVLPHCEYVATEMNNDIINKTFFIIY
jgi:hypothetical protein